MRRRHDPARALEFTAWALHQQAQKLASPLRKGKPLAADDSEQLVSILRALADTREPVRDAIRELGGGRAQLSEVDDRLLGRVLRTSRGWDEIRELLDGHRYTDANYDENAPRNRTTGRFAPSTDAAAPAESMQTQQLPERRPGAE